MGLLGWALVAFVISIIAAVFGFTGIARGAATIARVLFGLFLFIALVLVVLVLLGIDIITIPYPYLLLG